MLYCFDYPLSMIICCITYLINNHLTTYVTNPQDTESDSDPESGTESDTDSGIIYGPGSDSGSISSCGSGSGYKS